MTDLKDVIKKENILKLEKQIEELDQEYQYNIELPMKKNMVFNLHQGIVYQTNLTKEYIPKKIELEVKLGLLKGVKE